MMRVPSFQCNVCMYRRFSRLSYLHNVGEEPLKYITVGGILEQSVNKYGDRECLVSLPQNERYTFADIYDRTTKLSAGLTDFGFRKGDRLGIWCPNLVEYYVTKIACNRIGIIVVALNPFYQAPEIEYCINKVKMKGLVCPDNIEAHKYYDILMSIAPEISHNDPGKTKSPRIPSLDTVITISDRTLKGTYNFQEIASGADQSSIDRLSKLQANVSPDDPSDIMYSSGTTGKPKATVLSHFNTVNNAYFSGKRNELDRKVHKICMMVPLFHGFGSTTSMLGALTHGSTLVVPALFYSAMKSLEALKKEKCTQIHGTPTMYVDLVKLQKEKNEPIDLEIAVWGAAIVAPSFLQSMFEVLKVKKVKSIYGLTETTCVAFQSKVDQDPSKTLTTVGQLGDHVEAKVVDTDNKVVPLGSSGELCIRGYINMLGYWDDEGKTKGTLSSDGWLRTGDQFVLQEDGSGKIVGRLKEMIIRGGENIFPREVEDILNAHPDIIEAHVIGLPHDRLGEVVCACLRIEKNSRLNLETVRDYCKEKIANEKIPTVLQIVESFPKTQSGKIQKFKLVELFVK